MNGKQIDVSAKYSVQFIDKIDGEVVKTDTRGSDLKALLSADFATIVSYSKIADDDLQMRRALLSAQASLLTYDSLPGDTVPASNSIVARDIECLQLIQKDFRYFISTATTLELEAIRNELTYLYYNTTDKDNSAALQLAKSAVCSELAARGGKR